MSDQLTDAAKSVGSARSRFLWALGHIPDDKLTYSPTPTAKSALQIASHVIAANGFFTSALTGGVVTGAPAMDVGEIASRQEAVERINASTDALLAAINALSPERLDAVIPTPFGDSSAAFFLGIAGVHTFGHAAQLEYLQTCWGDLDFHWNG